MAFWLGILGAIVVFSIITLIFKYATKSKSYDEAMAEQRKFERNLMRAKSKQSQSKKPKVTKESSQPEKRSKTAPAPAAVIKDTKKVEPVKNNPVNGVDKVVSYVVLLGHSFKALPLLPKVTDLRPVTIEIIAHSYTVDDLLSDDF